MPDKRNHSITIRLSRSELSDLDMLQTEHDHLSTRSDFARKLLFAELAHPWTESRRADAEKHDRILSRLEAALDAVNSDQVANALTRFEVLIHYAAPLLAKAYMDQMGRAGETSGALTLDRLETLIRGYSEPPTSKETKSKTEEKPASEPETGRLL